MKTVTFLGILLVSLSLTACQGVQLPLIFDNLNAIRQAQIEDETLDDARAEPTYGVGEAAPNFNLSSLAGEEIALDNFQGQSIALNFWATWCGPCREEMPILERLYETYQADGFVVLGVSVDDGGAAEAVSEFVAEFDLTYPIMHDADHQLTDAESGYPVPGIPTTFFINSDGLIEDVVIGSPDWNHMEGNVLNLVDPEAGQRRAAALKVMAAGAEFAQAGQLDEAATQFEKALALDPTLELAEPEIEARQISAQYQLREGEQLVSEGQVAEALAAYEAAQATDPMLEISARQWNSLCWYGSLWNEAEAVIKACDQAVALAGSAQKAAHQDSRGVARALLGDYEGAAEDFRLFVEWSKENGQYERYGSKREAWIVELEAGNNPLDEETLTELRYE